MRVVLHLDTELALLPFAGGTVGSHWLQIVSAAGLSLAEASAEPALHISGQFPSVNPHTLAGLTEPGDVLLTRHGAIVAFVGISAADVDRQDATLCATAESYNLEERGGLVLAEREVRRKFAMALLDRGVQVVDPDRVTIDPTVEVGPGVKIWPDCVLLGSTRIDAGAEIRIGCWIEDSTIGSKALIKPHSVCTGAHVGPNSHVGPMAHLRPGAVLRGDNKVGNFVEVKKSTLHDGAKASHLTYLGDSEIGAGANIGAGTITCNYDGHRKHRTRIGAGAFIGSNTALVAPIQVGDGAIVGAGSTLTRDVPADGLAVVRGPTRVLEGKGKVLNDRNARLKAKELADRTE